MFLAMHTKYCCARPPSQLGVASNRQNPRLQLNRASRHNRNDERTTTKDDCARTFPVPSPPIHRGKKNVHIHHDPPPPFRRVDSPTPPHSATMPSPRNWGLWTKVIVAGIGVSVGGPALTYWVVPTEEELRARYNPDLLRKSIEGRAEREAEFNDFVTRLKAYSKSDKPIWTVIKEEEERQKRREATSTKELAREAEARREAMRKEVGLE